MRKKINNDNMITVIEPSAEKIVYSEYLKNQLRGNFLGRCIDGSYGLCASVWGGGGRGGGSQGLFSGTELTYGLIWYDPFLW